MDIPLLPIGGIGPEDMAAYVTAGANGFGTDGLLYGPGCSTEEVSARAIIYVVAWRAAQKKFAPDVA